MILRACSVFRRQMNATLKVFFNRQGQVQHSWKISHVFAFTSSVSPVGATDNCYKPKPSDFSPWCMWHLYVCKMTRVCVFFVHKSAKWQPSGFQREKHVRGPLPRNNSSSFKYRENSTLSRSAKRSPLGAARLWVIPVDEVTLGGNAITSRGGNSQVDKTGLHLHGQILIMTANVLGIKIFLYKSKHTGHSSTGRRICFRNYKPIQGNITRIPFFSSQRNLSDEKKFWTN